MVMKSVRKYDNMFAKKIITIKTKGINTFMLIINIIKITKKKIFLKEINKNMKKKMLKIKKKKI